MKPIMMLLLLGLGACAARFSETNYDRMVDIVVATRDAGIACASRDSMLQTQAAMHRDAIHVLEHSRGRSRDEDIQSMVQDLIAEIDGFGTRLSQGSVSNFYCRSKIENINTGARTMLRAEGGKPRS